MRSTLTRSFRRHTLAATALAGVLAALGLAGCGGNEDTASGTPTPTSSAAATTLTI